MIDDAQSARNLDYVLTIFFSISSLVEVIEQGRENHFKGEKEEEEKKNHLREMFVMSQQCTYLTVSIISHR